jgi:hypothetical protein
MTSYPKSIAEEWAKPTPIRRVIIDVEPTGNETAANRTAAYRTGNMARERDVRPSPARTNTTRTRHNRHQATLIRLRGWSLSAFRALLEIAIIIGSALLIAGVAASLSFALLLFMVQYWQR